MSEAHYDDDARSALFADLACVMLGAMRPGMSFAECQAIHLDAVQWLAASLIVAGTPEAAIQSVVHAGVAAVHRMGGAHG